jgi:RNA recognition motif-containing protein
MSADYNQDYPVASHHEPKGPPQACLFVANLPSSEVPEERLREHFSQFGEVLKVKVIKQDRSNRPYAFVQFANIEDANEALKSNKLFEGKRLRVERAKVNRTLFIAKLSKSMTNAQLREQAEQFGAVENVAIIKDHQTNKSKGCGFVKYVYREDSMEAFAGLKANNRKWVVEWATSTNDPDTLGVDKFNIFIGGLNPVDVTKELLEEKFGQYGDIESITLINKDEGHESAEASMQGQGQALRSAFAFIRYTDPSSSSAAIEAENGVEWLGRRIRVQYCESAEMKSKRRAGKYMQSTTSSTAMVSAPSFAAPQSVATPQFYTTMGRGVPTPVVPAPMLVMSGVPMYNIPAVGAPSVPKFSVYGASGSSPSSGRKDMPVPSALYPMPGIQAYPINPALLAYAQQPWLFAQQAQMQAQTSPQPMLQGRTHHSSQQRHREGASSPASDDSLGNEADSGLTQSIATWVLK